MENDEVLVSWKSLSIFTIIESYSCWITSVHKKREETYLELVLALLFVESDHNKPISGLQIEV